MFGMPVDLKAGLGLTSPDKFINWEPGGPSLVRNNHLLAKWGGCLFEKCHSGKILIEGGLRARSLQQQRGRLQSTRDDELAVGVSTGA